MDLSVLGLATKKPELQDASCFLATDLIEGQHKEWRNVYITHFCLLAWKESNFRSACLKGIIFNFSVCLVEDSMFLTMYLYKITCVFYFPVIKEKQKEKVLFFSPPFFSFFILF